MHVTGRWLPLLAKPRSTPQYSLALLIDAARRDDKQQVGTLVDTDKVVDGFVPEIIDSAVDLYGRGLPPETIANLTFVAAADHAGTKGPCTSGDPQSHPRPHSEI